jgi:hypothetical protein
MTISSETRRAGPYSGNGSTVNFPFAFKVFTTAQVLVTRTVSGVETVLTLTTDYTVTLNSNQNSNPGGTVTMLSAPAVGQTVTITSNVANLQPVAVVNAGGFYPEIFNDAFDRATIQIQQLDERLDRALVIPVSSSGIDTELPPPESGKLIGWDGLGTGLQNYSNLPTGPTVYQYVHQLIATAGQTVVGLPVNYTLGANAITVFVNGLRVEPGAGLDYVETDTTTITFNSGLASGDLVVVAIHGNISTGILTLAPVLGAVSSLNFASGDYIEATGVDTFRARKLTVATYAALTAIPAASRHDDMLVYVASRSADGDGGEGYWRFDSGSSATANGGTILAPDAGSGRWLRQYSGAASHFWFGAKGDGVTDDTAAVQAAHDAGVALHNESGIFLVSTISVKVRVTGACTYKRKSGSTGDFITSGAAGVIVGIQFDMNSVGGVNDKLFYITHDDCETLPEFVARNGVQNGVDTRNANNVKIRGTIIDCVQTHVFVLADTQDVTGLVIDVTVDGSALGTSQLNGGVKIHAKEGYEIEGPVITAQVYLAENANMVDNAVCIELIGFNSEISGYTGATSKISNAIVRGNTFGGSIGCTLAGCEDSSAQVIAAGSRLLGLEITANCSRVGYVDGSVVSAGSGGVGPDYGVTCTGSSDDCYATVNVSGVTNSRDSNAASFYCAKSSRVTFSGLVTQAAGDHYLRNIDGPSLTIRNMRCSGSVTRLITFANSTSNCDGARFIDVEATGLARPVQGASNHDGAYFYNCRFDNSSSILWAGSPSVLTNNQYWQCRFTTQPFGSGAENINVLEYVPGGASLLDLERAGTPEGFITASVGSTCRRTDSGTSPKYYVKESGTGSTGWIPVSVTTPTDTAANIAAVGNAINTTGKYAGKLVWDTTNTRMMRASGSAAADPWVVIDGSASVTPA